MQCRHFVNALEDHFARHPDQISGALPVEIQQHSVSCRGCHVRLQTLLQSRNLMRALRGPDVAVDPYFMTRLRMRLDGQPAKPAMGSGWRSLHIASRDLVLASVLCVAMLGSFLYNLNRTERPNADEAMALDVPHLNAQHPSDDHLRPRNSDIMVSLLAP